MDALWYWPAGMLMSAFACTRNVGGSSVIALGLALAGFVAGDAIAHSKSNIADRAISLVATTRAEQPSSAAIQPVALLTKDDHGALARAGTRIAVAAIEPRDRTTDTATLPIASIRRAGREPFGRATEVAAEGPVWTKWRALEAEINADLVLLARCRADAPECSPAAQRFVAIVESARARSGRARIGEVNRAVNLAIRPMSDLAQHGIIDRWSAPLATFTSGAGDCEDYAVAKYVALREAGMADEDLRLVIVRHQPTFEDHAVLAARLDGRWLVLDNRTLLLVEDNDVKNFEPMFVLDHKGVQHVAERETPPAREAQAPADLGGTSAPM
jgi:predicted transglutaminase-like cysteine proteinase